MKMTKNWILALLQATIPVLTVTMIGCAGTDLNLRIHRDHKSSFDRQAASDSYNQVAHARDQGTTPKELPDLASDELERLGDSYFSRGNLQMAFLQYEKSLRLDSENIRLYYKKGLLFLAGRMNEDAIKEFQNVLKKQPKYALAYEGLGQAYFQMKKFYDAERHFREAAALGPTLWKTHTFLGILYDYRGQYKKAVHHYTVAIGLQPHRGFLYNNLGISYSLAGDYENAINSFNKALKTNASQNNVYNNLGLALSKLGRYREAFEAFGKGAGQAQAYNNLGCIYLGQGEYEKAARCFEKAVELKPDFYEKAIENLQKCRMAHLRESLF